MKSTLENTARNSGYRTLVRSMAIVIGSSLVLSACSKVPDAINPAAWYRSTSDFIAGDEQESPENAGNQLRADRGKAPPGADGESPNLARVEQQMQQRENMQSGLAADTQGRKYADSVQRQDEAAKDSLYAEDKTPPPAPQVEAQKAAPDPQPAKPVTSAEPPAPPTPKPDAPQDQTVTQSAEQTKQEPVTSVSNGPDASFGIDPGMKQRLQQQLAEIQARAADQGSLLPSDMGNAGDEGTVIISSGGVETAMAPGSMQFRNTGGMQSGPVANNGALPLPSSSTKVATILFRNGSSGLDANDRKILADVARLQRENNATVRVIGHASQRTRNMDPNRHKQANYEVSVMRANQVASELQRLGIASERILTAAVGDNQPIYLEVMPSGEAGNRRTEIYLSN
ncbi:MAG: OmpA family protein [Rhodospirillales bacterium]